MELPDIVISAPKARGRPKKLRELVDKTTEKYPGWLLRVCVEMQFYESDESKKQIDSDLLKAHRTIAAIPISLVETPANNPAELITSLTLSEVAVSTMKELGFTSGSCDRCHRVFFDSQALNDHKLNCGSKAGVPTAEN